MRFNRRWLIMAGDRSCAWFLPWLWAIEALACSEQVDLSLIIGLLKAAPEIPNELEQNAMEILLLRISERFSSRAGGDSSENCEEALRPLLSELPSLGQGTLKFDFDSISKHTKTGLTKCVLQKLKEAILGGSNPVLASLKERSGLAVKNRPESDGGQTDTTAHRVEGSCISPVGGGAEGLVSLSNKSGVDRDRAPDRNQLPQKRGHDVSYAEDVRMKSIENPLTMIDSCIPHSSAAKKPKHVEHSGKPSGSLGSVSLCGNELMQDPCERINEHNREEACHLLKENEGSSLEQCRTPRDSYLRNDASNLHIQNQLGCNDYQLSRKPVTGAMLEENIPAVETVRETEFSGELRANVISEGKIPEKISLDILRGSCERTLPKIASDNAALAKSQDNAEDHHNNDSCNIPSLDISSDSDDFHDEERNISSMKDMFLNGRSPITQDPFAESEWTELNLCVKCNKGDRLLVCSTATCPVGVHQSCLGFDPRFDEHGNFYCPHCAYLRAISEYTRAKKKAALAKKELSTFFGSRVQEQRKKVFQKSHKAKKTGTEENLYGRNTLGYEVEDLAGTSRKISTLGQDKEDPMIGRNCGSPRRLQNQHNAGQTVVNSDISQGCGVPNSSDRPNETEKQKADENRPVIAPRDKGFDTLRNEADKSLDAEIDVSKVNANVPNNLNRLRKPNVQYSYPATPQFRRKALPWSKLEEEMLQEGLKRFADHQERGIPWRKILDYGRDVFGKDRTTIDLKDKWRNLTKGSSKSK